MQSQILRIPSGYLDSVNDPAIGQAVASPGSLASKFAGQLGMEVELRQEMIWLRNPAVPVAGGWFQYVRLAPGSAVPAVGSTVNWDATADKRAFQVTASAGTAAGTALTANVTPGNYTIIQTKVGVPTGTLSALPRGAEPEDEAAQAEADAILKAKAEGKTDEEAADEGRRARKEAEAKAKAEAEKAEKAEAREGRAAPNQDLPERSAPGRPGTKPAPPR